MKVASRIAVYFQTKQEIRRLGKLLREVEVSARIGSILTDLNAIATGRRTSDDSLRELADLLVSRRGIAEVLARFANPGVSDRERLVELYKRLLMEGAAQKIRGTYVATAALYDPTLLMLLLQVEQDKTNKLPLGVIALRYVAGERPI